MQIDTLRRMANKRIADCTDDEISKTLIKVYYLVGLRAAHYPTPAEDKFIFNYLRKKYGYRNIDELLFAFDLAINNFLDVDEVKVYDQFSIEYMVRILNSYGRYVSRLISEQAPVIKPAELPPPMDDDKMKAELIYWKTKEVEFDLLPTYLYNYLEKLGYLNLKPIKEDKLNLMAAKVRLKKLQSVCNPGTRDDRNALNDFKAMLDAGEIVGKERNIVKTIAKRLVIQHFLNFVS